MCASISIRSDRRQDGCEIFEAFDADLRQPRRHARAVAFVEHPVRLLAGEIGPLVRANACEVLAAPERRHLQRAPEPRVPRTGDPCNPKTKCRMSRTGRGAPRKTRPHHRSASCADDPAPAPPSLRSHSSRPSRRRQDKPERRCRTRFCPFHRPDHLRQRGRLKFRAPVQLHWQEQRLRQAESSAFLSSCRHA